MFAIPAVPLILLYKLFFLCVCYHAALQDDERYRCHPGCQLHRISSLSTLCGDDVQYLADQLDNDSDFDE